MCLDDREHRLSRSAARRLADALGDAASGRREFAHTAGERRPDGTYVVTRRRATSAGNAKTFDSFERLCRLYDDLPASFDAEAVGGVGVTGSRRHMVVRHLAEHPAFDCHLTGQNPLTAEKAPERVEGGD